MSIPRNEVCFDGKRLYMAVPAAQSHFLVSALVSVANASQEAVDLALLDHPGGFSKEANERERPTPPPKAP
ncbi:MAG: hypothetical protein OXC93_14515 [Rhodospirillaceae bacterium]|nr:hypothetical protein [Rhodospirillaceae bacterium]